MKIMTNRAVRFNVKNLFVQFYIVLPFLFYLPPYLLSLESGGVSLHFYKTFYIEESYFFRMLVGHVILGLGTYKLLSLFKFELVFLNKKSILSDIVVVLLFIASFTINIGYIQMLVLPLLYILYSRRRPYNFTFLILFFVAFVQLVLGEDRFPVIQVALLAFIPYISRISSVKLFMYGMLVVFGLVFVLQPLRSGHLPLVGTSVFTDLAYFYQHLQPIYIGGYLLMEQDFSLLHLIAESVPFLKSLFGFESVIDTIGKIGLTSNVYDSGTRHGSNSSLFFSFYGAIILFTGVSLLAISAKFVKWRVFSNSIVLYFIVQGPYFVRRSFGTFLIDFVSVFICACVVVLLIQLFRKKTENNETIA